MRPIAVGWLRHCRFSLKSRLKDGLRVGKRGALSCGITLPPFRLQVDVTDRCNFRCPTCSKWNAEHPRKELGPDGWNVILGKVCRFPVLREVSFTGGEPFCKPGILSILRTAKARGLYTLVTTNGSLLDESLSRDVFATGVDRLMVSLNSLVEESHDRSRGFSGSFARIMAAIELWAREPRETDLCLAAVITEENCGELSELAEFTVSKGLNGIIFQVLAHDDAHYAFGETESMPNVPKDWPDKHPQWVRDHDKLNREIDNLLKQKRSGYPIINSVWHLRQMKKYYAIPDVCRGIPCLGPFTTFYIDPYGDVRLCYGYPPVGNLMHDEPKKLWYGDAARAIRRQVRSCRRLCRMLNNNL